MPCRHALRQRDGHHESGVADLGGGSCCCAAERVTPQLVEGLDRWASKFFLHFGSQVRGIGDHRQELEAAF
eukprot:51161-Pleurochrysis_carterae.AAC.1